MESLDACITEVAIVTKRFMRHSNTSAVEPFPTEIATQLVICLAFPAYGTHSEATYFTRGV